jgi:mono/diheme cytochrome c family protein
MKAVVKVLCLGLFASSFSMAGEPEVKLKQGSGKALVLSNCGSCHSLDYISMNSPLLDRAGWEKSLKKNGRGHGGAYPSSGST